MRLRPRRAVRAIAGIVIALVLPLLGAGPAYAGCHFVGAAGVGEDVCTPPCPPGPC